MIYIESISLHVFQRYDMSLHRSQIHYMYFTLFWHRLHVYNKIHYMTLHDFYMILHWIYLITCWHYMSLHRSQIHYMYFTLFWHRLHVFYMYLVLFTHVLHDNYMSCQLLSYNHSMALGLVFVVNSQSDLFSWEILSRQSTWMVVAFLPVSGPEST